MIFVCGFSKVDITPPFGTTLAGYSYKRSADSVSDNLFARIVYMQKGEQKLCLVEMDLIAVDKYLCERISNECGVETYCWATHTHSGPGGFFDKNSKVLNSIKSVFGEYNKVYYDMLINQIIQGIKNAQRNCDEARIRVDRSYLLGVGANRQNKDGFFSPEILTLEIKKNNGQRAVIYNYSCHPTVLNKYNKSISADFPGYTAKFLEEYCGIELCMFLNGAAGDISTRFTRKESSIEEAKRLGNIVARELIKIINRNDKYEDVIEFDFRQQHIKVNMRKFPSIYDVEREYYKRLEILNNFKEKDIKKIRILQSELEGAEINLMYAKSFAKVKNIETLLSCIVINNNIIIGVPGELFNKLGDKIKKHNTTNNIFVGSYFQDYIGYIVPKPEYEKNSYESLTTVLEKGTGEYVVSEAIKLVKAQMKGD